MIDVTKPFRLYASYRASKLKKLDPVAAQEKTLRDLISRASETEFGAAHGFSSLQTVEDYQRRVPLRRYEDFWDLYWKNRYPTLTNVTWPGTVPYFALSSGTSSGTTKYIPITHEMVRSNTQGALDLIVHHLDSRPSSRLLGGKVFFLGGSTDLTQAAADVKSGDLSGIAALNIPWWLKNRYFPSAELALMKNWEEKIAVLARESLKQDIRFIGGVPSWLLIFFTKIQEISGKTVAEAFPNLELLVHGGVNFLPYHAQFVELLKGTRAELREVYPASEGFIASADRGFGEGLKLMLDHGIFFEFVPVDELDSPKPTRHWVKNIETGVNYAVVITSCAGLWSYVLGDTVKFTEVNPPRLLVTGRTSYSLSAFGEHLIADEVEDAVSRGAEAIGRSITDYSVGALYPNSPRELGGHLYVIEFKGGEPSRTELDRLGGVIDKRLCERNEDYEAHRAQGFGLNAPLICAVPEGTFARWMKARGKLGGQNKVPRLISKRELFTHLLTFCGIEQGFPQSSAIPHS